MTDNTFLMSLSFKSGFNRESRANFNLLPRKGLNVPNSVYDEEKQLQIYEEFVNQALDLGFDGLGLSFVQTGSS